MRGRYHMAICCGEKMVPAKQDTIALSDDGQ